MTAQTHLYNSGATVQKFTKFLSDTDGSSAVLKSVFTLPSSNPLWNASAQNKGGVCQFLPNGAKNQLS